MRWVKFAIMEYTPINICQKLGKFAELWSPKVIAQLNDYQFKLVKLQGEFVWHSHADTDEVFLVVVVRRYVTLNAGSRTEGSSWTTPSHY